jgi:transmembrane 9 superfamily protein 2/4
VGRLNSIKTLFPFGYYSIPVCHQNNFTRAAENLGEILSGDYSYSTHYEAFMGKDEYCKILCSRKIESLYEENIFTWMIEREYTSTWYLDTLTAGLNYTYKSGNPSDRVIHDFGIPLGENQGFDMKPSIFNHFTFQIFINIDPKLEKPYSIVEFNIIPWR